MIESKPAQFKLNSATTIYYILSDGVFTNILKLIGFCSTQALFTLCKRLPYSMAFWSFYLSGFQVSLGSLLTVKCYYILLSKKIAAKILFKIFIFK